MRVKIKRWEDMEKEFGLARDGSVDCPNAYFEIDMEEALPKDRVIRIDEYRVWKDKNGEEWEIDRAMVEAYLD